jgi:hypothetical protein
MSAKRAADRLILGALRAMPRRIARHAMHLLRAHPAVADAWGYHVREIHYYEPIPDFRAITAAQLEARRVPASIDFNLEAQAALIADLAARCAAELRAIAAAGAFPFENEYFAGRDAAVYYALVRKLRPKRVVEIGAGYSTRIVALALAENEREGSPGTLAVIEPYPEPRLTESGVKMDLHVKPVEKVDPSLFATLRAGDILFIDSSHAVRTGGDVVFEFLDLLPRIPAGVWIHVHDIFFPFDYPAAWVLERRVAWNEQYLLEAFLAFNREFEPKLCVHWLETDYPDRMRALLERAAPGERAARGASFWMARR